LKDEEPGYHKKGRVGIGTTGQHQSFLTGALVGITFEGRGEKPVVVCRGGVVTGF